MKKLLYVFCFWILLFELAACSSARLSLKGYGNLSAEEVHGKPCESFTCVQEVDSTFQQELGKEGRRLLQIYLIRHAKPNLGKKCFYSREEAQQYMEAYNKVPIVSFERSLVKVDLGPDHTIYCSSLRRSQETAFAIFGDRFPIVPDSVFREFEIKAIKVNSVIKLPLFFWQAFSRGSWFLGWNHKGIESHREAQQRAQWSAGNLIRVAEREETAILVGHGMLNGAIEKELIRSGWVTLQSKGQINLGATLLVKIVPK